MCARASSVWEYMCSLIPPTLVSSAGRAPGDLQRAVAPELGGTGPQCAGCTLALCWRALPGLCPTASCPACCGAPGGVAKAEMC